jgi:glycosyltransferase involved in cell wall biosynthesis
VPRPRDRLTSGFIGHPGKHKGLEVLLRALPHLDLDRIRLLVVGDGDKTEYLLALCQELHAESAVTLYGHVDNQRIAAIHQQIDVLIMPSVWPDSSPVTISEAMAGGIPVIASDIGGIRELVEDEVTGFLVPPRHVQALSERIQRLLAHPELLQEMGEKGLAKIQPYSLRNQVNRIRVVYREVVDQAAIAHALDADVLLYDSDQPWNMHIGEMFRQLAVVERERNKRLLICRATLADEETYGIAKLLLIPSSDRDSLRLAL